MVKFVLIWALAGQGGMMGSVNSLTSGTYDFSSQEKCEAVKTAMLKWYKDTVYVRADCFPQ